MSALEVFPILNSYALGNISSDMSYKLEALLFSVSDIDYRSTRELGLWSLLRLSNPIVYRKSIMSLRRVMLSPQEIKDLNVICGQITTKSLFDGNINSVVTTLNMLATSSCRLKMIALILLIRTVSMTPKFFLSLISQDGLATLTKFSQYYINNSVVGTYSVLAMIQLELEWIIKPEIFVNVFWGKFDKDLIYLCNSVTIEHIARRYDSSGISGFLFRIIPTDLEISGYGYIYTMLNIMEAPTARKLAFPVLCEKLKLASNEKQQNFYCALLLIGYDREKIHEYLLDLGKIKVPKAFLSYLEQKPTVSTMILNYLSLFFKSRTTVSIETLSQIIPECYTFDAFTLYATQIPMVGKI